MRTRWIALTALALSVAAGAPRAEERETPDHGSYWAGIGTFDLAHASTSQGVGLEYRLDSRPLRPRKSRRFTLIPALGLTGTSRNAIFGYVGLRSDFDLGPRWRLTPGFAAGAYERNGDIDLGGPVEFRSSLDVSYALNNGVRVGASLYHISNARLYERNPGVNALVFVQTF